MILKKTVEREEIGGRKVQYSVDASKCETSVGDCCCVHDAVVVMYLCPQLSMDKMLKNRVERCMNTFIWKFMQSDTGSKIIEIRFVFKK